MNAFKYHKLEENQDGYTLYLYLDDSLTEFSLEFIEKFRRKDKKLNQNISDYVKEEFPNKKINTCKILFGSVLVCSLSFAGVANPKIAKAENITTNPSSTIHTVQSGDSLWKISQKYNVSIDNIKEYNALTSENIYVGQQLYLTQPPTKEKPTIEYEYYTVQKGDSLWGISKKYNTTVNEIKSFNNLTSDSIIVGQKLKVKEIRTQNITHTIVSGDTLWKISQNYNVTVDAIKAQNNLTNNTLNIGQKLVIPIEKTNPTPAPAKENPQPTKEWPAVTYIVQSGDTVSGISKKYGVPAADILKYNYMSKDQWLDAGDKIAISDYAPRVYTVFANESSTWQRTGKIVDWYLEGQYLIKRWDTFKIVDVETGKVFTVRMMGGYNHSDIEPVTFQDTQTMKELFGTWKWSPRAVVIYKDGMNIAASLSGMPHGASTITNNSVTGHFDLYLQNSRPHSIKASDQYVQQHYDMILRATRK